MPAGRFQITVDGEALAPGLAARLAEIDIREGDGMAASARIKIALAQSAEGTFAAIDDGPFQPGSEIRVSLAAPGGSPQFVFAGVTSHVRPHFETIETNCYLEIVATDHAMVLAAEDRARGYPGASDADAAREVLGRYNLPIDAEDTEARPDADDILLMQRSDDWSFVRMLAKRNGFTVYFEPDPQDGSPICHFHRRNLDDEPQADLTILRENPNLEWIDFEVALDRPAARSAAAIDHVAKRLIRADAESADALMGEALLAAAAQDGVVRLGAAAAVRHLRGAPPRDAALNAHAAGQAARDHMVIEARGLLDPALYRGLLRPHRPVLIKGVGDRLAGRYYVSCLATSLKDGELRQSFTAVANALGRGRAEPFGQSAEEEPPL